MLADLALTKTAYLNGENCRTKKPSELRSAGCPRAVAMALAVPDSARHASRRQGHRIAVPLARRDQRIASLTAALAPIDELTDKTLEALNQDPNGFVDLSGS